MVDNEVQKGYFSRKVATVTEAFGDTFGSADLYEIVEYVSLEKAAFEAFSENLLEDQSFLEGKGGTRGGLRQCVAVYTTEATFCLLVDPQGHNYARYVRVAPNIARK